MVRVVQVAIVKAHHIAEELVQQVRLKSSKSGSIIGGELGSHGADAWQVLFHDEVRRSCDGAHGNVA